MAELRKPGIESMGWSEITCQRRNLGYRLRDTERRGAPREPLSQMQHRLFGHDVFCTQHRFGHLAPALAKKSIKLFAEGK